MAWCNDKTDRNKLLSEFHLQQDAMCNAELEARQKKLGLWAQASEPPWVWRDKNHRDISHVTQNDLNKWRAQREADIFQKEKVEAEALAKAEFEKSPEGIALRKASDAENRARRAQDAAANAMSSAVNAARQAENQARHAENQARQAENQARQTEIKVQQIQQQIRHNNIMNW